MGEDCILVKDCPLGKCIFKYIEFYLYVYSFADAMCQENQTYQEGGYDCASCTNLMLVSCQFKNQPGCYCKPDYVWNIDYQGCSLIKECPKIN